MEWPVSARIDRYAGGVRLTVDGKVVNPMIFYGGGGGKDYPEHDPFFETIPMARDRQVRIVFWENIYDDLAYDDEINERVFSLHPDCLGIIRIGFYPTLDKEEMCVSATGETTYVASYSSLEYRRQLKERIEAYVAWLRGKHYASRIIGVQVMFGTTGEWYYDVNNLAIGDYSRASRDGFRKHLKLKYKTIRKLNTVWSSKFKSFDEADVPDVPTRMAGADGSFRLPSQQNCIDYEDYFTTAITDLIKFAADTYKDTAGDNFLIGVLYGYDSMFAGWKVPQATGAFGLNKILKFARVDFISSPLFYHDRRAGLGSEPMGYFHTLALNGKMFILENDTRNYMTAAPDWLHKDDYRAGGVFGTDTLEQSLNIDIRDSLTQTIMSGGMYWMDLVSRGWWKDEAIWDLNHILLAVAASKMQGDDSFAFGIDVALVIDEDTTNHTSLSNSKLMSEMYTRQTRELARTGYSYGFFHMEDIDRLPENVKTVIFVNPGKMSKAVRQAIENLKSGNRVLIFIYAVEYIGDAVNDVKGAVKITGMNIIKSASTLLSDSTFIERTGPDMIHCDETKVNFPEGLSLYPAFCVEDPEATAAACYISRETSVAFRKFDGWTSVYSGVPRMCGELIKAFTRLSGTEPYCNTGSGFLKTDGRLFLYHASAGREETVTLKLRKESRVVDVINNRLIGEHVSAFTFNVSPAQSRAFMAFQGKRTGVPLPEGDVLTVDSSGTQEIEFTGNYVCVRTVRSPQGGRIGVTIDGAEYPYIETYAAENSTGEFLISFNLKDQKHILGLCRLSAAHRDSTGHAAEITGITAGSKDGLTTTSK